MNISERPSSVNILGIPYTITYVDKPSETDIFKRKSLWGQIDYWTRSIRIYDNRADEDVWQSILHEIIHGIATGLKLEPLEDDEDCISLLALALIDVLIRNGWFEK